MPASFHAPARDPQTGEPLPPKETPGYYAGFHTMSQKAFWDEATRAVVEARVSEPPPIRFFTSAEVAFMECLVDHLLPQGDRLPEHRIPLVRFIDDRLHHDRIPGYRFETMPPDREAYRLGFDALDGMAQKARGCPFVELDWQTQEELLQSVHDAEPWPGAGAIWEKMPVERYWALVLGDCAGAYYGHPWAWDEIGFGGPAYPRAYFRLSDGEPEPWEVEEQRYDWAPPEGVRSYPIADAEASHTHRPAHGQIGTH